MNEKNISNNPLSNCTISVRVGYDFQFIDVGVFTAICDRFLYEEIVDLLTQSPTNGIFYSGMRNKVKFVLHIYPKLEDVCPVS